MAHSATQYGMDSKVVTKAPASITPPGQDQSGQGEQIEVMPRPEAPAGCPPGLEYLTQLDQIVLHQHWEHFSTRFKFQIKNDLGQQIYFATLTPNVPFQPLVTHFYDSTGQEVIRIIRHFRWCANNCWCDLFQLCAENCWCDECCKYSTLNVTVEAPPGQPIGHIQQRGSSWKPRFVILDANFEPLFKLEGQCFCCCCSDGGCDCGIDLPVMSYDGSREIGRITKEWAGCLNEFRRGGNDLILTFPRDLDVKMKATLFGALF